MVKAIKSKNFTVITLAYFIKIYIDKKPVKTVGNVCLNELFVCGIFIARLRY